MIDVAELLSAHGLPYAVIGAMAAAVYGVGRARDVDLSGFTLRVIGREDFIAMKAHAGGAVDLAD